MVAIALEPHRREAAVEVERPPHPPGGDVLLEEAEGSRLAPVLDGGGVVAGLGDEVDAASDGVGPVAKGVGPLKTSTRLVSINSIDSKSLNPSA